MIERAARCLEAGARSLAHASQMPLRSKRALHSAFWCHGAGDIDLPAWWISFLQVPQISKKRHSVKRSHLTVNGVFSNSQELGLLDFLYPAQTMAIIQQFVKKNKMCWGHRSGVGNTTHSSRTYTSVAKDALPDEVATCDDAKIQSVENVSSGSVESEEDSYYTSPEYLMDPEKIRATFNKLLESPNEISGHDKVWRHFQSLQALKQILSSRELIRMMRFLGSSPTASSVERLLWLFNQQIPIERRRGIHYSYAISAVLSQDDLETAVMIHREACSQTKALIGISQILRYTVEKEKWKEAIQLWEEHFHDGIANDEIWAGVESLPPSSFATKATALADWALRILEAGTSHNFAVTRNFAMTIIMKCFSAQTDVISAVEHQSLFEKAKKIRSDLDLYKSAIIQLLRSKKRSHEQTAFTYYRDMRANEKLVPDLVILDSILNRFFAIRSSRGILEVLEDYRKYYRGLPRTKFKEVMRQLSMQGDIESVQSLFDEYVCRFGNPAKISIFNSLLNTFQRRAETHNVVEKFHSLQKDYRFNPTIISWNHVMGTFCRVGDVDGALSWFKKLGEAGLKPNSHSYALLMQMFGKRSDLEAVVELLRESELNEISPSIAMINAIVLAQIKNGQLVNAKKLIEDSLQTDAVGRRTKMWNFLINAYAQVGDLEEVTRTYRRMRNFDVPPDEITFSLLMQSLAVRKFPDAAAKILKTVMPRAGLRPSAIHYAVVMGGYLATKEYYNIFALYRQMLENNIKPGHSTQNLVLRAATAIDLKDESHEESQEKRLPRADMILSQALKTLDAAQLGSSEPLKFVGLDKLDEAFSSSYFSFMIFVYGKQHSFDRVVELFDQYIATTKRIQSTNDVSLPIRMLSALMVVHVENQDHDEAERCWYLALDKAEHLAGRFPRDVSQSNWVLHSRRFILTLPLIHYMKSLESQGKIKSIISTVKDLHRSGYELDSRCWNVYVQILGSSRHESLAFTLCERELMREWYGWHVMGHPYNIKRRLQRASPKRYEITRRFPMYKTFVCLAGAYMEIRSKGKAKLMALERAAPKTVEAVRNLPKLNDMTQAIILNKS